MVYRKYREVKQWGKVNTRIFKGMVQGRELLPMPRFEVPAALKALGVAVHDPNRRGFFEEVERADSRPKDREQDHPLFKAARAFLFEGRRPFADGVEQACALIGALPPHPLARQFDGWSRLERPADEEALVADAILAGERFDPTLEKLPRVHDPVLFWPHKRDRVHGTPVAKRNSIILANLHRRVLLHALRHGQQKGQRMDYDAPFSAFLPADQLGATEPLVVRHQPALVVQSGEPVRPLWSAEEVEATRSERTPDVYPLSPFVDLDHTHVYNEEPLVPRPRVPGLHVNTLLFTKELDQKYPLTTEELAANAIVFCFGAALAQRQREAAGRPVVAKAVQLAAGRLDLVAVQLNNVDLADPGAPKNLVWLEKALPLYSPRPFDQPVRDVDALNLETFHKFANLLLH